MANPKSLDASALLCYKPLAPMSDHSQSTACRTQATDAGRFYAPFYAWRFS
jgi:hypothetical protein